MQLNCYFPHRSCGDGMTQQWISVMSRNQKANHRTIANLFRAMKLIAVIMLAGTLTVSATGISQHVSFSGKNVPLQKVLQVIKKQTGFVALTSAELLSTAKPVSIEAKNMPLKDFLMLALKDQPINFSLDDKNIILEKKLEVVAKTNPTVSLTTPPVMGIVKGPDGQPIVGANIIVKGTKRGTTTNANGSFSIEANSGDIIIISSIGFADRKITVGKDNIESIFLALSQSKLDEVQIIAYGTTTKKLNTGNTGNLKAKDIETQPVTNPLLALQGRVPGLFVQQTSGVTSGAVNITIQGPNSLQNGNVPFFVVDGVPYASDFLGNTLMRDAIPGGGGSTFNYINPNDIESITILKDADATAIYGSRAANGAILITTKKGKVGKTKLNLNLQNGWGNIDHKLDFLNTQQYLQLRKEAYINAGQNVPTSMTNPASSNYDLTIWDQDSTKDWQKALVGGTATFTNLQATLSGGSPTTQFLISYAYIRQSTVYPNSLADIKGNLYFNLNHISNNNKFKYNLSASFLQDGNSLNTSDLMDIATKLAPNAPSLNNPDGTLNFAPFPTNPSRYSFSNPLTITKQRYNGNANNLIGNNTISYEIIKNLIIKTSVGYNRLQSDETKILPITAFRPDIITKIRSANYLTKTMSSYIVEPQITYEKQTKIGKIEALIGGTYQYGKNNLLSQTGIGYANDNQLEDLLAASSIVVNSTLNSESKYSAVFGRLNYRLEDKYVVNLTMRRDGSSRFGDKNKFHSFYAIGSAWIFSEEQFIKDKLRWLSTGKIRASYGTTGNDQIPDYSYLSLLNNYPLEVPYQQSVGLYSESISNPLLQWEETRKLNIGIDLGTFNNNLQLSFNYFINRSSNQLIAYTLPTITGFTNIMRNFPANVKNSGLEIQIDISPLKSRNLNWISSFNLTIPKNKLVSFYGLETSTYSTQYIIGQPINIVKAYKFSGVNPTTGLYEVINSKGQKTSTPDQTIDRTELLDINPKFYGGFSNNFQFKGLELSFLFQFVKQLAESLRFGNYPGLSVLNQPTTVLNRWQKEGDVATVQKASRAEEIIAPFDAANSSDAAYSGASYIRLKNASFSYSLPNKWLNSIHLTQVKVFMQGQNLITITDFVGSDPESKGRGTLPPLRIFTFGLQIGL
jgi:TonB-dependent starch-binding outer membrane protein SusC